LGVFCRRAEFLDVAAQSHAYGCRQRALERDF
jgi:hypothetical protein